MNLLKIKRSVGIFSVLFLFGIGFSVFAQNNSSSAEGVFSDFDQDGLSNEEEAVYGTDPNNSDSDGDGYSDGTEVQSGYDPLKPAPGDKIINESVESPESESVDGGESGDDVNLTKEIAQRLAEAVSSEDEEEANLVLEETEDMIQGIVSEDESVGELPEIDESKIKVKEQNYSHFSEEKQTRKEKEDNEEYITTVYYLAAENSPYKISGPSDLGDFEQEIVSRVSSFSDLKNISTKTEYFENMAEKGESLLDQLENVEVPEDMVDLHKKGMQILTESGLLKDEVEIDVSDPIESLVALGRVQVFLALIMDFQEEVADKMIELGIDQKKLEI